MGSFQRHRHPAGPKTPSMQLGLIALVAVAAVGSAISSRLSHVPGSNAADAIDAVSRTPGSSATPTESAAAPSEPVEYATEAARRGDLDAYLAQFTGSLLAQLTRTRAEKGDTYFRDYLYRLTVPIKGVAADLNRQQTIGPHAIRLPVDFIYADRREAQVFELSNEGNRWRISRIDLVRAVPTFIPYGTPIEQVKEVRALP